MQLKSKMTRRSVYRCKHCPQTFQEKQLLNLHYSTDHRINTTTQASSSSESSLRCNYCGKRIQTKRGMPNHIKHTPSCAAQHREYLSSLYSTDTGASGDEESEGEQDIDMESPEGSENPRNDADDRLHDVDMRSNHWDEEDHVPAAEDEQFPQDNDRTHTGRLRGTETFVERYPKPTVGTPIREATKEERLRANHADVGRLADPDLFEVAEILMTSGLSGKKRDKFLKLNRVSYVSRSDWRTKPGLTVNS